MENKVSKEQIVELMGAPCADGVVVAVTYALERLGITIDGKVLFRVASYIVLDLTLQDRPLVFDCEDTFPSFMAERVKMLGELANAGLVEGIDEEEIRGHIRHLIAAFTWAYLEKHKDQFKLLVNRCKYEVAEGFPDVEGQHEIDEKTKGN